MSKSSSAIVLDLKQLGELSSYAHWIPITRGLHRPYFERNFPGWEWNLIIPILVKAKILVTNSKDPANRALNQGLYIAHDVAVVEICIEGGVTEIEVRRK
jgi:hypothetical protein